MVQKLVLQKVKMAKNGSISALQILSTIPIAVTLFWAPDVIEHKGIYHTYLTYVPVFLKTGIIRE
jgi:beta-xylosidase